MFLFRITCIEDDYKYFAIVCILYIVSLINDCIRKFVRYNNPYYNNTFYTLMETLVCILSVWIIFF